MDKNGSNYRESRKQEIRERVIDTAELVRREEEEEAKEKKRRTRRRRVLIIVLVILFLLIAGTSYYLIHRQYTSFTVNWRSEGDGAQAAITDSDYEEYLPFSKGFLKVTMDGASYSDAQGKTVWNQSYEMNTPYVSVNGDFCAIADQDRTGIYIASDAGPTGQAETNLPITKIAVSGTGVVYALLEDSSASYITVFAKDGTALDISIKSILSGDGYPLDISVSPDGTELIASFVSLAGGTLENKIIFYNLGQVGQSAGNNRVVGGFTDDFAGHLTGRVHFSDDTHAQAFYDGGIAFFSTKVLTSPELLKKAEITGTIRAIAYDDELVGVIADNDQENADSPYLLHVYRTNGQTVFEKPISFHYSGFTIDRNRILLYNDTSLQIYDGSGNLKFDGTVDVPVRNARIAQDIRGAFGVNVLIGSSGVMESIKLH